MLYTVTITERKDLGYFAEKNDGRGPKMDIKVHLMDSGFAIEVPGVRRTQPELLEPTLVRARLLVDLPIGTKIIVVADHQISWRWHACTNGCQVECCPNTGCRIWQATMWRLANQADFQDRFALACGLAA